MPYCGDSVSDKTKKGVYTGATSTCPLEQINHN